MGAARDRGIERFCPPCVGGGKYRVEFPNKNGRVCDLTPRRSCLHRLQRERRGLGDVAKLSCIDDVLVNIDFILE